MRSIHRSKARVGRRLAAIALACVVWPLASCSSHAPELRSVAARLFVRPEGQSRAERLSVFANAYDEDGFADLSVLYLIHDESGLFWKLDEENWTEKDESGDTWVGSPELASFEASGADAATGLAFPRGPYRLVLVDKSGERAERTFRLDMARTGDAALPSVSVKDGSIKVVSPYPSNTLFFYGKSGDVVRTVAAPSVERPLEQVFGGPDFAVVADTVAVYGFDPRKETGFFSWKTKLAN